MAPEGGEVEWGLWQAGAFLGACAAEKLETALAVGADTSLTAQETRAGILQANPLPLRYWGTAAALKTVIDLTRIAGVAMGRAGAIDARMQFFTRRATGGIVPGWTWSGSGSTLKSAIDAAPKARLPCR